MGMIDRLVRAHPDVSITAYDGHYARIGDADSHILSHVEVAKDGRRTTIRAVEEGRRKDPKPKAVEARLDRLIADFGRKAA